VDPVPDPLLLRNSGSAGNRTRTSGSVARNSDHQTAEAVLGYMPTKVILIILIKHPPHTYYHKNKNEQVNSVESYFI
jgi:hypothetical protein